MVAKEYGGEESFPPPMGMTGAEFDASAALDGRAALESVLSAVKFSQSWILDWNAVTLMGILRNRDILAIGGSAIIVVGSVMRWSRGSRKLGSKG